MKVFFLLAVLLFIQVVPSSAAHRYSTSDSGAIDSVTREATLKNDSTPVDVRAFEAEQLQDLRDDSDLNYQQPPTVAESLWQRFVAWLKHMFLELIRGAVATNWGNVLIYIGGLAVLVVVIMMLLKVNAFKVLYSAQGVQAKQAVIEENIHEMDFEALIQESIARHDYRRGIRLLFLYALKLMADKHLIDWQAGKTNHDYVEELGEADLKKGFNELSFYFDYAWYGNFRITDDTFQRAQGIFTDWKQKIS